MKGKEDNGKKERGENRKKTGGIHSILI